MDQFVLNWIFIGASFALYIGIAVWARAGSTSEFYAAGQGVHPVVNGMATGADWMSAASFISMAGLIAFTGYDNSSFLMGWTGGYVLLALMLAPYLRKFGKFTVSEFIGDRFYSPTARLVAVICLIVASTTYVIGQMTGVGVAFGRFLEVDNTTGLLIGAAVVFAYAVFGGMKGVTYTQVAQYCVLIIAYTIPAIFISLQLTGNPIPALGLFGDHAASGEPLLMKLDQIVTELGFKEYTAHHADTLNMVLFTLSLMIGTAGLPHVIMRFFTVPTVSSARWSAGWTLVFIALLYLTAPAVGAMARLNISDMMWPNGTSSEPVSVEMMETDERYAWMATWQKTGLLNWEDKNGDGKIAYFNDANPEKVAAMEAAGLGSENELVKFNRDILVLANPEIANLPGWVIALVAAGGLAAALSTAAGLLLAISSAVSHDLIKGAISPNISEKGELMSARIAMAVAIAIATYLGLNPPGFAAQTVALAFGLAAASIFPALMMGIFTKVNNKGAVAGMLAGLVVTLVYIFLHKGWFFIPGTNSFSDADPLLGTIKSTSFGAVGAMINFIVAFLVSKSSEAIPAEINELVENVRIPKGAGAAAADH
ncbi:Cation/acetate symporter ActP [Aliiroseovarius sp. xm-m-379]|uniref:sodium:solute symporter family protein n=1 Tax=unclassified Aliiroseovarius TaxID=2623558 RepID=UPI00156A2EE8|nr:MULTISPECIES: sodium:solute symporter family protein [unclassified Aliiroseovarius]NRP25088.1 Cation/acetate symporter ActP [Aliiroseovarius sp. xm-m-379]NRP31391.1 Cation/acetate symporter ActP [Aliiroseovarius sp. xm-m-314]NRP33887.1 Cation/acetate symporter ActP [Aliiroseovarius sp. xm-a-104]NRP45375.1 Cation/acetate symporter ActP [Aliiroseovarius sp. xm-m-378]NRP50566.1 Cation/acetate symporter ActP [Aliiroseovarius sp. xm-m-354]